jgi:hypothetical protein
LLTARKCWEIVNLVINGFLRKIPLHGIMLLLRATGYELDVRGIIVRVSVRAEFFHIHVVMAGCGVLPTSYAMYIGSSYPRVKAAEA